MSNGYLVATEADIPVARELAGGFGLDVIEAERIGDIEAVAATLAGAANVGLLISNAAAQDLPYVALLQTLAHRLRTAQLIIIDLDARAAFQFLPQGWPAMTLGDARARASELTRRRQTSEGGETPRAHPLPSEPPPAAAEPPAPEPAPPVQQAEPTPVDAEPAPPPSEVEQEQGTDSLGAGHDDVAPAPPADETPAEETPAPPPAGAAPPATLEPPPQAAAPPAAAPAPAPDLPRQRADSDAARDGRSSIPAPSAPADATAFAPRKLRRGTPELIRIAIHQPKDLQAVIRAAKQIDPRAEPAPSGMAIGAVPLGASVGVSLEVRGAACDGAIQRRVWQGEPIDFSFSVEADSDVRQAVVLARVFIDDAQIGVLAFTRPVGGPAKKPHSTGDRVRLKRHKRVFLSYSSADREIVSAIATAYERAGVAHFWDRASLKSGEEWSPRLRREIERADLFHLCWSKSAAASEWVQKEAEFALTRRRRAKKPEITVQMLDGPPWAKHPDSLDAINFDDFVRAAIVGYARGDA